MGSFNNIRCAKDAICSLVMGTPAGKVYSSLKYVSKRLSEKFWFFIFYFVYLISNPRTCPLDID